MTAYRFSGMTDSPHAIAKEDLGSARHSRVAFAIAVYKRREIYITGGNLGEETEDISKTALIFNLKTL